MVVVHRLTVNGRDYFLPEPVETLRQQILRAIREGGDYVHIPPLTSGPGVDILFSPGMPVQWTQLEVGRDASEDTPNDHTAGFDDFGH